MLVPSIAAQNNSTFIAIVLYDKIYDIVRLSPPKLLKGLNLYISNGP